MLASHVAQQQQQLGGTGGDGAVQAAMGRWRAAKRHVRKLQDEIAEEEDPKEKADLQELLENAELAVAAARLAYEAACEQLPP